MKKFFLPIMLSAVLVMFLDCEAETPVQSNDNSILLLGKPSVTAGAFCFNDMLTVSWNSIGGASEYRVFYIPPSGGNWTPLTTAPVKHGQKSYSYLIDVSSWTSGSYLIMVEALNRKGNIKSSNQVQVTISH
jgi:hypothetical protein